MRLEGDTGVQTHVKAFHYYLMAQKKPLQIVTPFERNKWIVYPLFALRKAIDYLSKPLSVWWYRYWHAFFLYINLKATLASGETCVIYAQCPLSANAALQARCSKKQRVVMVVHFNISQAEEWADKGMISKSSSLFSAIQLFELQVLPRVDALVFVSNFMRQELLGRIAEIQKIPFQVIPNFLHDPQAGSFRGESEKDLICIGTLETRKNQRYAIEIIAAAKKKNRELSLTIVGDGPDLAMLKLLCKELKVTDLVEFSGYVKNGAGLIPEHRAYLHVARIENLPLTLIESLAFSRPVFAPAVGGIPEVFNDSVEGRLIPLDNSQLAAQLIIEWLDSEQFMQDAQLAARRRYVDLFEESVVAKNLLEFIGGNFDCSKQ